MTARPALFRSEIPGFPHRSGKVRDLFDFGDRLLIVASDRISAFDWVMPNGIPDKGRILTGISCMWFERLGVEHHLISTDPNDVPLPAGADVESLRGRSMVVTKTNVVPIECVVRGYLAGSGWKEYQKSQSVCGIGLPAGLEQSARLPEPIFTPATKAETGHDENISFERMGSDIGQDLAEALRARSLQIYNAAAEYAAARGIILCDTKFEFGLVDGRPILIDEVLTPDSSRYWPADAYRTGISPPSYDKQFVRDWLETTGWDKNSPPPTLPDDVVAKTREKYIEAYRVLVGEEFPWA